MGDGALGFWGALREVFNLRHRPQPKQDHQGPGGKTAGLAMVFKLIEAAQSRCRAVNAPHLVALVRAGAAFKNGTLVDISLQYTQTATPADEREMEPENCGAPADH